MASFLTPRTLKRGLQIFLLISILGVAAVLVRTESIKFDKELVGKLQAGGMVVNEIKDKAPFVEGTKSVYDQFANIFPPELVKRIRDTPSKTYPYVQ